MIIQGPLKRTTDATVEPVSLTDAKHHLRVSGSDDDNYITSVITAARQVAEDYTGRAFITQTWTLEQDTFPSVFYLPRPPLIGVTHIKYTDTAGSSQTVSSDDYDVFTTNEPGEVREAYGAAWPTSRGDHNNVIATYTAGYGAAASNVPQAIVQAVLLILGHLYENRETVTDTKLAEVPMGAQALLHTYKVAMA